MKLIGITGGIGSGKSSVAKFLEDLNYPVYYSDNRSRLIVNENKDLINKIKQLLGDRAYDDEGKYNRKYVGTIVFDNSELLNSLNKLIHPAVKIDFENWMNSQESEFIFKETALLFELGLNETCSKSLLVTADDNLRIKRVMDRDGKTYREVENIINQQMSEKDKIKLADFVIYNNGSYDELKSETEKFISDLKNI